MQLIFQNDHVVINLVGVLFGGCYRRSYFELCVCARGQWKVRILRIGEHGVSDQTHCKLKLPTNGESVRRTHIAYSSRFVMVILLLEI